MAILFGLLCIVIPVSATTWYVNDDGGSDYTSIVDAVNDGWQTDLTVKAGDTICVLPGTYERFVVGRSINFQALNDKGPVIIDGASQDNAGIWVGGQSGDDASGTVFDGFTLNNCKDGISFGAYAPNSIVRNCIFNGMSFGIRFESSQNCTFENNIISSGTTSRMIYVRYGSCNIINNTITNVSSEYGHIYFRDTTGNCSVLNNTFTNVIVPSNYGLIYPRGTKGGTITVAGNTFDSTFEGGIPSTSVTTI